MKIAIVAVLLILVLPWCTFVMFCAVMQLRAVRNAGRLGQFNYMTRGYAYATLFIGAIFDFLLNTFVGSLFFIELPRWEIKEWLLSDRVSRLAKVGTPYQKKLATWVCHGTLQPIDTNHCHGVP